MWQSEWFPARKPIETNNQKITDLRPTKNTQNCVHVHGKNVPCNLMSDEDGGIRAKSFLVISLTRALPQSKDRNFQERDLAVPKTKMQTGPLDSGMISNLLWCVLCSCVRQSQFTQFSADLFTAFVRLTRMQPELQTTLENLVGPIVDVVLSAGNTQKEVKSYGQTNLFNCSETSRTQVRTFPLRCLSFLQKSSLSSRSVTIQKGLLFQLFNLRANLKQFYNLCFCFCDQK